MKRIFSITAFAVLGSICIIALVVRISRGVPSIKELQHVYDIGYSHPEITSRVGSVKNVSIALKKKEDVPFFAKQANWNWTRTTSSGRVAGIVQLWVLGTYEGGFFTVNYIYHEGDDVFTVTRVDTTAFDYPTKKPKDARETK